MTDELVTEADAINIQSFCQKAASRVIAAEQQIAVSSAQIADLEAKVAALTPAPAPVPVPVPPPDPTPTPTPTPSPTFGADLPVGPFTESTSAKWYRTTAGGTVSKQRVTGAPDYGVALMGTFSPAAPAPSTGVWTVTDCVGQNVGQEPPTMDGTGESGLWFGQKINADRCLGDGTWMGAWIGAQCCDSNITNLTCARMNADGTLARLPRIGLYIEHIARRVVIDGLTILAGGNGINAEWWYADNTYALWVAKELASAPAGKAGAWSIEIKNFDIDSGGWGIFLDAGACGYNIHDGILRGNNGISHPANLAVPSMPNVIDWATIDFRGTGSKEQIHTHTIG
jgi:hypothetical protein